MRGKKNGGITAARHEAPRGLLTSNVDEKNFHINFHVDCTRIRFKKKYEDFRKVKY